MTNFSYDGLIVYVYVRNPLNQRKNLRQILGPSLVPLPNSLVQQPSAGSLPPQSPQMPSAPSHLRAQDQRPDLAAAAQLPFTRSRQPHARLAMGDPYKDVCTTQRLSQHLSHSHPVPVASSPHPSARFLTLPLKLQNAAVRRRAGVGSCRAPRISFAISRMRGRVHSCLSRRYWT